MFLVLHGSPLSGASVLTTKGSLGRRTSQAFSQLVLLTDCGSPVPAATDDPTLTHVISLSIDSLTVVESRGRKWVSSCWLGLILSPRLSGRIRFLCFFLSSY